MSYAYFGNVGLFCYDFAGELKWSRNWDPVETRIGWRTAASPALDGKVLWELGPMSMTAIPTPFAAHGLLYVASGYVMDSTRPAYAIRPGAKGDISLKGESPSNEFIAWSLPQAGPYHPTPVVVGEMPRLTYFRPRRTNL